MFYTNKENNNYLMISKGDLYLLVNMNLKEELNNEIFSVLRSIKQYSREHNYTHIGEIALTKNNILSKFLLKENTGLINGDLEINCLKTANALNISLFENNPIANEILTLFKNRVCGNKRDLETIYDSDVLDYILKNNNFKYYIENLNGKYMPKIYIIYENGKCYERKLLNQISVKHKIYQNNSQ